MDGTTPNIRVLPFSSDVKHQTAEQEGKKEPQECVTDGKRLSKQRTKYLYRLPAQDSEDFSAAGCNSL